MIRLLRHLPNAMTCGNLLCGCIGTVQAMQGYLDTAAWLILLAAVLDFLDGFVARLLGVSSAIGKELDSLADCVTFGLLPAILVFQYCRVILQVGNVSYLAFLIAVLSALRLAKFNVDTRQTDRFIGVPTPANALLIASFPLIEQYQPYFNPLWQNNPTMGVLIGFSFLLVSELPLFALKFSTFGWRENRIKYIFLILSAGLLLFLRFAAVPVIILLYIVLSLFSRGEKVVR